MAPAAGRRGVQSVTVALRVLRALAAGRGPMPLRQVAELTGLPPSQTHRHLASLIAGGFAQQLAASGAYQLGPEAVALGLEALARLPALEAAAEAAAAVVAATGWTAMVTVPGPSGLVVVRWFHGRPPVFTSLAIGSVAPVETSASGHVLCAWSADKLPPGSRVLAAAERAAIRAAGHARTDGGLIPGLRALAAPVLDLQGSVAAVVTVVATEAHDRGQDDQVAATLIAHTANASRGLGAPPQALGRAASGGA